MTVLGPLLGLAMALPAPAAELRSAAPPVALDPLVVGTFRESGNPVALKMQELAEGLVLAPGALGELPPSEAAERLAPFLRPEAHPVERLAAGSLARMLAEPEEGRALLLDFPLLREAPLTRIPGLLAPLTAYRGDLGDSPVRALAREAGREPLLGGLFDGTAPPPSLRLEDASLGRSGPLVAGRRAERVLALKDEAYYRHPLVEGAFLEVPKRRHAGGEELWSIAPEERLAARVLGEERVSPRYLGQDTLYQRDTRMAVATVKEAVDGATLESLAKGLSLGDREYALVEDLVRRAALAGVDPDSIQLERIVIGRTATDPARRAYLLKAERVDPAEAFWADYPGKAMRWLSRSFRRLEELKSHYLGMYRTNAWYR